MFTVTAIAVPEKPMEELHLRVGGVLEFVQEHYGEAFPVGCTDLREPGKGYGVFDEVAEIEQGPFPFECLVAAG